jgi:hypothetical protein
LNDQSAKKQNYGIYFAALVSFLIAAVVIVRLYPWLQHKLRTLVLEYRSSEPFAFKKLRRAVQKRNERAVYQNLLDWMRHFDQNVSTNELSDENDEGLGIQLETLKRGLYAQTSTSIDWKALDHQLINLRSHALRQTDNDSQRGLPALNP